MKFDKLHSPQRRRERRVDAEIEFSANLCDLCVSAVKPIFSQVLRAGDLRKTRSTGAPKERHDLPVLRTSNHFCVVTQTPPLLDRMKFPEEDQTELLTVLGRPKYRARPVCSI
jgi:hypothetical protein